MGKFCLTISPKVTESELGKFTVLFRLSEFEDVNPLDQLFGREEEEEEESSDDPELLWLTSESTESVSSSFLDDVQLFDTWDFDSRSRLSTSESFDFDRFFNQEEFSDDCDCLWLTSDSTEDLQLSDFWDFDGLNSEDYNNSQSRFSKSEFSDDQYSWLSTSSDKSDTSFQDSCSRFSYSESPDDSSFSTDSRTSSFRSVVDDSEWPPNQNLPRIQIPLLDLYGEESDWVSGEEFVGSYPDFPSPTYHSNQKIQESDCNRDFGFHSYDSEDLDQPLYWPFSDDSYSSLENEKKFCSSPRKSTTTVLLKNLSSTAAGRNKESKITRCEDGVRQRTVTREPRRGMIQERRRRRRRSTCVKPAVMVKESSSVSSRSRISVQ